MKTATLLLMPLLMLTAALAPAGAATATAADAASPAGRWDAVVVVNSVEIPFRFEIAGTRDDVKGVFFDGDTKITSKKGTFKDGALSLAFDQYGATLEATLKENGQLEGKYLRGSRPTYAFRATRYVPVPRGSSAAPAAAAAADVPSISGLWKISLPEEVSKTSKGEKTWRFIVKQSGPDVSAAVLRVDGDTGNLTGTFKDGKFVLSHFSGARPALFEVTPQPDGSLAIVQNTKVKLTAVRVDDPRAKEVADPSDNATHTRIKDANERFRFRFNDLNGKTVTESDPRFQGKVVLVSISGSWCPNCRDEAPFLVSLHKKYRKQGFEIVSLDFEEEDQLANPTRLRAFIKEYGIEYPVLLAGIPDQLTEKVPQADNLNAFPTSFLLGRDGKVRAVHAGFPSPASGKFYTEAQREVTALVERLLAERPSGTQ
jgi:thiol-disulfide isomerase/thioredoxin